MRERCLLGHDIFLANPLKVIPVMLRLSGCFRLLAKADHVASFRAVSPYSAKGIILGSPTARRDCGMKSKDWLADPAGAQIPDSDALLADACAPLRHRTATPACCWRRRRHAPPRRREPRPVGTRWRSPRGAGGGPNFRTGRAGGLYPDLGGGVRSLDPKS